MININIYSWGESMPFGLKGAVITLLAIQAGVSQKIEVEPAAPLVKTSNHPAEQPPFIYRQLEEGIIKGIEDVVEEGVVLAEDAVEGAVELAEGAAKAAIAVPEVIIGAPLVALAEAYMPDGVQRTVAQELERDREAGEIAIKAVAESIFGKKNKPGDTEDSMEAEKDEL